MTISVTGHAALFDNMKTDIDICIERDYEAIDLRYLLRFICSYGAVFHFYLKHGTSLEKVYHFVVQNVYEPCGK